jgi:NAD(P)H-quinone oxidoreductase subunit 5
MLDYNSVIQYLGIVVVAAPALLVFFLCVPALLNRKLAERTISKSIQVAIVTGLLAAVAILALMLVSGTYHVPIDLGKWGEISDEYHFSIKFVFDRLSVPFVILTFVLTGTISAFGTRYMHREPGYNRFFVLYAIFALGMVTAAVADTIEVLFAGWEMVGLSSALLVSFFQERPAPARNGLRIWTVYRVSDAALLLAAVIMHHMAGKGDFDQLLGVGGSWPDGHASVTGGYTFIVGLLLLVAAAGKSALVPFSGWLPRAMEGPTPSSAIFYGALSVHLGAFLLLRVSPIFETSIWLSAAVVALGLTTAVFAYLAGSVQTDIKSALSYASLAQVGIIVAEIGFGFRYVALIHLLGHACLRTLQFVRAPTLLQDYRTLENAIGNRLPRLPGPWDRFCSEPVRVWLYRLAVERGYWDSLLNEYVVVPFTRLFQMFDGLERRWTDFLSGRASRASDQFKPYSGPIEELP